MTERYTDYNNWAWLYNRTMGPEYSQPQLQLLERVLLPHVPKGGKILDLCCGTGQLIQPLLELGYQVAGLDGSEEMLTYARQNAPEGTYVLEDARTFDLPEAFDGVFSTSASLNHIMSLQELSQVLKRVHRSLKPGGVFVFDLNHPEQLERWWRGQPTEGEISRYYAWMITPHYNASVAQGAFDVRIFQSSTRKLGWLERLFSPLKQLTYNLLNRPRFIGLRLKLLQNFARVEPSWDAKTLSYPVTGHPIAAVKAALERVGFRHVSVQTIDGAADIDNNHSAHFICAKPPTIASPMPPDRAPVTAPE
ncbi:MAG: class I SAM-dependent methyltransferase [Cyanobacteria bacterium P01_A01_bin.105]